jgi:hypothetical protein
MCLEAVNKIAGILSADSRSLNRNMKTPSFEHEVGPQFTMHKSSTDFFQQITLHLNRKQALNILKCMGFSEAEPDRRCPSTGCHVVIRAHQIYTLQGLTEVGQRIIWGQW